MADYGDDKVKSVRKSESKYSDDYGDYGDYDGGGYGDYGDYDGGGYGDYADGSCGPSGSCGPDGGCSDGGGGKDDMLMQLLMMLLQMLMGGEGGKPGGKGGGDPLMDFIKSIIDGPAGGAPQRQQSFAPPPPMPAWNDTAIGDRAPSVDVNVAP